MRRRCGVVLLILMALTPATARATTFTVVNEATAPGDCTATPNACNLLEAVTAANATPALDQIHFNIPGAGQHKILLTGTTLVLTAPVDIDGTTQPGFDPLAAPPIVLNETLGDVVRFDPGSSGSVRGVVIDGEAQNGVHVTATAGPVLVTGNVIGLNDDGTAVAGGFHHAAVFLEGDGSTVDGNVVAGALNDAAAAGVLVSRTGNTIVRNTVGLARDRTTPLDPTQTSQGIIVGCAADSTHVQDNLVGAVGIAINAGGACVTNGLLVSGNLLGTVAPNQTGVSLLGSFPGGSVSSNTIVASTLGAGVAIAGAAAGVTISRNSINGNAGLGIDLPGAGVTPNDLGDGDGIQNFPVIASATSDGAVTLALSSKPNRDYTLEVFASPACDPSGFGEGATYLGEAALHTDGAGAGRVVAAVAARPAGTILTATATDTVTGDTSEFSACATVAQAPPPPPLPTVLPTPTPTPAPQPRQLPPPPVLRKTVDVVPLNGPVRIRRPRAPRFVPLRQGDNIPVGSTVDATHGRVRLTSAANRRGKLQTAEFFGGQFKVTQARNGLTELVLNARISCSKGASAAKKKPRKRSLWGDGKGKFRTRGRYGSAAIRGTRWLTSDRCDGTHFAVRSGVVQVKDFTRHRSRLLRAGKRYRAPARR